ncbi:hypothetical protein T484DRAFT_1880516 [Baffinella frigidus]|nr:hypothetical protein T484DRAFT_1880516 [Cryptophyta sp. CCMP2293]
MVHSSATYDESLRTRSVGCASALLAVATKGMPAALWRANSNNTPAGDSAGPPPVFLEEVKMPIDSFDSIFHSGLAGRAPPRELAPSKGNSPCGSLLL